VRHFEIGNFMSDAVVYSFICPDGGGIDGKGRRYIGSVGDGHGRGKKLARSNARIDEALKRYPEDTWTYEVLAKLPTNRAMMIECIEQIYIDTYRTMLPEFGFNIMHADRKMCDWIAARFPICPLCSGITDSHGSWVPFGCKHIWGQKSECIKYAYKNEAA
jgi:hypothetical protein